jgi:penicillin-binding protein 1B
VNSKKIKRGVGLGIVIAAILLIFFVVYVLILDRLITKKFAGPKWDIPSKVYSDSLELYPGIAIDAIGLKEKLNRLGYQKIENEVTRNGEFKIEAEEPEPKEEEEEEERFETWTIYLHDFSYPFKEFNGLPVRFEIKDGVIEKIEAKKNEEEFEEVELTEIEPELITEFFENRREDRQIVKLTEVPPNLSNAIIAIEDQRFLSHGGIDPRGILRAIYSNIRAGGIVQGGSTITQQLVKNFFLTQKRSFIRKFNEAVMAVMIEHKYSKDEILETYLNEVYFGQRGPAGIFGVAEAARFYFAKPLKELTLAECAALAAIIRSPRLYSPFKNRNAVIQRRNLVLKKMLESRTILKSEYLEATHEDLRPGLIAISSNIAPYFVDFVRQELLEHYSAKTLNTQGLKIFTTLEISLQILANDAVQTTLKRLESSFPALKTSAPKKFEEKFEPLQAAFISIQPQSGYIRALVGGRDYNETQFNRVVQAYRQPGSLFKPFVFLAAFLQKGGSQYKLTGTQIDEPFQWRYEGQTWEPKNYEETFRGEVTLREALENSINIPTAKLAREIGIKPIAALAKRMGIKTKLPPLPSIALGSSEVTMSDIATAYAVLANGGTHSTPLSIKHVVSPDGKVLEQRPIKIKKIIPDDISYLITYALQGAIDRGTARGLRMMNFSQTAAGKTGTTSDYMDAWFAGYTPNLLAVSWVGFDRKRPLGLTGPQAAMPMWGHFMKKAARMLPVSQFLVPETIVFKKIDPKSGFLAVKKCPQIMEEAFVKGTEPLLPCPLHSNKKEVLIKK